MTEIEIGDNERSIILKIAHKLTFFRPEMDAEDIAHDAIEWLIQNPKYLEGEKGAGYYYAVHKAMRKEHRRWTQLDPKEREFGMTKKRWRKPFIRLDDVLTAQQQAEERGEPVTLTYGSDHRSEDTLLEMLDIATKREKRPAYPRKQRKDTIANKIKQGLPRKTYKCKFCGSPFRAVERGGRTAPKYCPAVIRPCRQRHHRMVEQRMEREAEK